MSQRPITIMIVDDHVVIRSGLRMLIEHDQRMQVVAQAGNRILPVMNGGKGHRGVEGLVLERKALRGGSHASRCACGTLRTHDRRRLHRNDVTVGGLVGAGARSVGLR